MDGVTRLLIVYGTDAPDVLRRMTDEFEYLGETERSNGDRHNG